MGPTRRQTIYGLFLGGISIPLFSLATRRVDDEFYRIIREHFGSDIARNPEATAFIQDATALWVKNKTKTKQILRPNYWLLSAISENANAERASLESAIVQTFLRTTNVVQVYETGEEELIYLGLIDPYEAPCSNPLSSHWV